MKNQIANSKRIAKNTLVLYARMLLTMAITLYTSRVVLDVLGIDDYGIYSVVGGVVAMFTIISGSLSAAISRFITFELGFGNQEKLNKIFSTALIIQLIIGILVFTLGQTVGMWFVNNKMIIPEGRMFAAQWVLHFSLIALVVNLISIPYNATIIAHEKMSVFAYISIVESVCKLILAYLIAISPIDKLVTYSISMCAIAVLVRIIYGIYCRKHFLECRNISFAFNRPIFKEMLAFSGWNFIGSSAVLLRVQGGNILLNLFFGTVVNAAHGISSQVAAAANQFSTNFLTALNPQITKSYAAGDKEYLNTLIFQGSRFSFYMLLLVSLPILVQTQYVLQVWLNEVPKYTVMFVKLALVFSLIEVISAPLITTMLATGRIRNYQIVVGGFQMMNLPISYILLQMGLFPEIVPIVAICISVFCLIARLYMLRGMIEFCLNLFVKRVILNLLFVTIASLLVPILVVDFFDPTFITFVLISILTVLSTITAIYFVGCSRDERTFLLQKIRSYVKPKSSAR